MKKKGQMIAGIGLGVVLLGAVGIYGWQSGLFDNEQETTETETTGVKQPKPITQEEILAESLHELEENVEVNGLVWHISSVEIVNNYESLDEYYRNRDSLLNPKDMLFLTTNSFLEEEQWLILKYTVTNDDVEGKTIYPGALEFYDRVEDAEFEIFGAYAGIDGRCLNMDLQNKEFQSAAVGIPAGVTLEFEYVRQFDSYQSPIYDLYVSFDQAANNVTGMGGGGQLFQKKVCLGIAPKLRAAYYVEAADSAEEARDIPAMKARQWTNLDMKAYQEAGYPQASDKDGVVAYETEEIVEQGYEFVDDITTRIKDSKVVSWSEMPADFQSRGALETMAQQYEEKYGVSREDLKILLLDISYTARGFSSDTTEPYIFDFEFYNMSWLFTRDSAGKRWVFGTMDDWLVVSNTADTTRTGHINIEKMQNGDALLVQGAYILPPEIYENHDALYFCGGDLRMGNYDGAPVAEISLE